MDVKVFRWIVDSFKLSAVLVIAGVTICLGVLAYFYAQHVDHVLKEDLLRRAKLVAGAMDFDDVERLRGVESDMGTQAYDRLKRQLIAVRSVDPSCCFFYLMERQPIIGGDEDHVVFWLIVSLRARRMSHQLGRVTTKFQMSIYVRSRRQCPSSWVPSLTVGGNGSRP